MKEKAKSKTKKQKGDWTIIIREWERNDLALRLS